MVGWRGQPSPPPTASGLRSRLLLRVDVLGGIDSRAGGRRASKVSDAALVLLLLLNSSWLEPELCLQLVLVHLLAPGKVLLVV